MYSQRHLLNPSRLRLLGWLIVLMTSGFMFTYNGRIESTDTRTLFNATASLVQYNDLLLDKTAWYNKPSPFFSPAPLPLTQFDAEPLQVTLPAPLFWLAEHLPGIGLVHAVWLFNVIISTAIGGVLFLYVLTLGYDERVAVFATLVLTFTTIIWPYSKSFFREPLAAFLILLAAFFIERWRASQYHSILRFGLSVTAVAGAFLTKDAVILGLPALFILILPSPGRSLRQRQWLHIAVTVFLVLVILFLLAFLYIPMFISSPQLMEFYRHLGVILHVGQSVIGYAHIALHSYLFSFGGSVWATSPVGLLAIVGIWMLYRSRQYRYIGVVISLVGGFALGYAILRGQHWFGGLSWPPRFLVPVVPFLVIAALPVFNRVLHHPTRGWTAMVAVVLIYGLWIQICAVSLDWGAYNAALPPEAGGLGEWGGGLNDVRYLRWVLIPTLWSRFPLDFAWVRMGLTAWPVVCVLLALIALIAISRLLKSPNVIPSRTWTKWLPVAGLLSLPIMIYLGLRALYPDTLYLGDNQSLHNIVPVLQANTHPGDVLLLADDNYEPFFLNYDTLALPRVITLSDQPGERSNPGDTPKVVSANPDALLVTDTVGFLYNLAAVHDHLWLLADTSHWITWSVRPVERFMVAHFYPIRELSTDPPDPLVRLIEYSTIPAPDPFGFRQPEQMSDLRFGDSIRLLGYDLPSGTTYKPGSVLPISLYWQSDAPLHEDYTVAWFVADQNSNTVTQGYDAQPAWGFAPTTSWQRGVPVWDNRALQLPSDVQPGKYTLWIRLYNTAPTGEITLLPVTAGTALKDTIGVLPVSIDIQPY